MKCHIGAWLPLFVTAAVLSEVHGQFKQSCGVDDFVCNNGMCLESAKRCDHVFDCPGNEDELNCDCTSDDFRCKSDGSCIEKRRHCDGTPNCRDGSDEIGCGKHSCKDAGRFRCGDGTCISILLRCDGFRDCHHDGSDEFNCPCTPDQWQCDQGNCIKKSLRCNGRVDCPSDRSDERYCVALGYYKCQTGKVIPESMRCNRRYDCPTGDYSDEQNCPCGDDDYKCNNGHCIPAYKRCDRTHDCQDGSDELHCNYGTDCMAYEYKCTSGICVHAESFCNGTVECDDGSDESKCPCKRGQFQCRDNSCINIVLRCNGHKDCELGEDELNCGPCAPDAFSCPASSRVQCATRCDELNECDNGEDEEDCDDDCAHKCDDKCLQYYQICNGVRDCADESDETECDHCDRPEDFRCDDGECIRKSEKCNNVTECSDGSDEQHCNDTISATRDGCLVGQYRCRDGTCLNSEFRCDGNRDCYDNSDEENCQCQSNEFTCDNRQCIPEVDKCNGRVDCTDGSDELPEYCENVYTESYPSNPSLDFTTTSADTYVPGTGGSRPSYSPYAPRTERPQTNDVPSNGDRYDNTITSQAPNGQYDPYRTERPGSNDPYGPRQPATNYPSYNPYNGSPSWRQPDSSDPNGSNQQPVPNDPYGSNQPESNNPYGSGQPGSSDSNGSGQPGSNDSNGSDQQPGSSDPYGSNQPESNNPYGSRQPGSSDPNGSNQQPVPNDPYGSNQPESYDPYGTRQPGSSNSDGSDQQPGSNDPYGSNQPESYDPYGSRQPGSSDPNGSNQQPAPNDPYGSNQPESYDPYGSRQPGSSNSDGSDQQPGSNDPYGSNQPESYDPYGSRQPGSSNSDGSDQQPGSNDPYGSNQPESYDPYGSRQPGSSDPNGSNQQPGSSDPYASNQPESYDPYGSRQPGSSNSYGSRQPGSSDSNGPEQRPESSDTYGSNQPESNNPYGSRQPGSSGSYGSYGSNQPGPNDIDSNRFNSDPNQYPDSDNQSGGGRYPGSSSSGQGGQSGYPGSSGGSSVVCKRDEWRCENGPCIKTRQRCDGHIDCPYDFSDEFDCPQDSPITLDVKTHPEQQTVRTGGDVVFQCRDEGPLRAPVRWVREGGRSLKAGSKDKNGRLELFQVTLSDSGVYICQTPRYLGQPGSEVRVTLSVNRSNSDDTRRPPFRPCKPEEATCSNGECILKSYVCNGNFDCSDKSDEDMCNYNGVCEPNQFQCDNRKCVLKSWLCDSDDDCGDGSDEKNCLSVNPNSNCLPMEFPCQSRTQCVPKSFHCDGRSDCLDGSDEIGCSAVYITKPPSPANVRLNPGDSLTLTCQAVGIPEPIISWRLNWGHVPPKCTSTNNAGVGVLNCPNMLPDDSGAYSCEAINNKGTTFAVPDSIVFVSRTDPCPDGYFNDEARSQSECIRCFCFGQATRCHSADLFTYNMPTPLGEGGTRLLGVALSGDGKVRTDTSIINHYYYQSLRNGAAVTKLESRDDIWLGNFHPYLTLPESYNGNQLTSYGGHIKYTVHAHTYALQQEDDIPAIIVKGKYATLYHVSRNDVTPSKSTEIEARFVPQYWEKSGPNGNLIPATREDIMMALDAVEIILLRADNNNAGVNITDFVMESAQHMNSGLGAASLVEECTCPEGYDGLSCQKCKPGYVREKSGPWLGPCVRKTCPPGTYGDPSMGSACKPCPCPLTNKANQFATTCSQGSDGTVSCDCFSGYEGKNCEKCSAGYEGNPLVIGDTCRVRPTSNCNPFGTQQELLGECICNDNVVGQFCDQCQNNSFYLSKDFSNGCALCFCSGESQQCMSSNLRRRTTSVNFNDPSITNEISVYHILPEEDDSFRYTAPVETNLRPTLTSGGLRLSGIDRSQPMVYYWSMPLSFAGDKVTAYGGYLRYTLDNVPSYVSQGLRNKAADIQLISENHLPFLYFVDFKPAYEGVLNVSIQLLEKGWQRSDGKDVPRELFLLALADVKTFLIKATYATDSIATPLFASIDTADANGDGPAAVHVEQCVCPAGHTGTSCEDCAPGYTRGVGGLYLAHCEACQCNGHSRNCHPETGQCYECTDNTSGPRCELCKEGYERDGYDNCIAYDTPTTSSPCQCDPRGESEPCDLDGLCTCKRNVDGDYCDRCRAGTYGLDAANPDGCTTCFCSGATTYCQEAKHLYRTAIPAPIFGDNNGGYTIMDINAETIINDQFMPEPDKSELKYIFTFPADRDLYWSLPVFPGNRVLSYGGSLSLRQEFKSNSGDDVESMQGNDVILIGDDVSVSWYNPNTLRSGKSMSYQVPLREEGWAILNSAEPADRSDFMHVLKSLRRVLVKATLAENILYTSIADVSMDTATDQLQPNAPIAKGIEACSCPPGHLGTSCETCAAGYYKNEQDFCAQCPCNGHDCHLDTNSQVVCNCRPPYTGQDCSTIGLLMELHPTLRDDDDPEFKQVTLTCKYRAPEPLTIKFVVEGQDYEPVRLANESSLYSDGWHGEHVMQTRWDTREDGKIYECHTITQRGSTLGVLFTDMRKSALEGGGQPLVTTNRPPMPQPSVSVRITNNKDKQNIIIQEIGSSIRLICKADSQYARRLVLSWSKVDGYLPQDRAIYDDYSGELRITNLQITDSGQYMCQTSDGHSTGQASVTLKVPANQMVLPSVEIRPPVKEYYAGDRIELECIASGSPQPTISWQRASGRPLPISTQHYEKFLIIDSAKEDDSGEYRCIAVNTVGSADRVAVIKVRARPSRPTPDRLVVQPQSATINEGQSTTVVCTGSTNVPTGTIDWIRQDGDKFQANVRSDNGVLYIDVATLINAGVYICQTHGSDVAPQPVLVTVLTTKLPSPDQAPDVTIPVNRITIPSGESNKIDCIPHGQPLPLVRWTKYENEFGPGVSQRGNSLIINEAQESDRGYYTCQAIDRRDNVVLTYKFVYVEIEKRDKPIVEIWPVGENPVALGDTQFEFTCRVLGGTPSPVISWSRAGGRTLSQHAHIRPNNILRFDKIEVNDEGEYICTGDNSVGSFSSSSVIKVRSPPEITITPRNYLEVTSGEPVSIDCRADGYPEPWVTIKGPDDNEVSSQSRIASLRLSSVSERDAGTYKCMANNLAGTIEDAFVIRVENDRGDGGYDYGGSGDIDIEPYQPEQTPEPYPGPKLDTIVFMNGEVMFRCNVNPGFKASWVRGDSQPLQRNAEQRGNDFFIHNVSKSDSGPYVCLGRDETVGNVYTASYQNVRVVSELVITLKPDRQVVQPGYSPTVECVVTGDEHVDITWRPISKPFSRRVVARNGTLLFRQITAEDAGKYMCVARNEYTSTNSTAEVIVVGIECLDTEFRCNDDGSCIDKDRVCDDFEDCNDLSDEDNCLLRDKRYSQSTGAPGQALVRIEQPRRAFREGEKVEVLCRSVTPDINVEWIKRDDQGNRQHVDSRTFGGGSLLVINGVAEDDAGMYQCIGRNRYDQNYTEFFDLDVLPGTAVDIPRYTNMPPKEYSASLRAPVDIPCIHDLEEPVSIQWRREYSVVPIDARSNQPILHINSVKEGDAGTYVCRASNRRTSKETKYILRVVGVVPRFDGNSWVAMQTLKDAYRQFDIEISFKPTDPDGLILYNSQNSDRNTKYLALELRQGEPWFIIETGNGPSYVRGNKPLTLNEWHTIRINKIGTRVTMDVDNEPFAVVLPNNFMLELRRPLYIGGVPEPKQLPTYINSTKGFSGCVSSLVLGQVEKNIMVDLIDMYRVTSCDTCMGNLCQNGSICQEARNERGYVCICDKEFAGPNCDRRGEACRPGLCGTGKCTDTIDGYKCACPITHTGKNCETRQQIDYPAFTGSEFLAMRPPNTYRFLKMSMKVKASAPVTDGIIMYCAESPRGHGGFTSLAVKNGRLEFRYDLGEGTPVVLVSNTTLPANDWTDVQVTRSGPTVSLNINLVHNYEQRLDSSKSLKLGTPMFVGGVDENIVLNSNTGVSVGFMGCIKDLKSHGISVDFANDPNVESSNVRECSERGDIQEAENNPCRCINGGTCSSMNTCVCPFGFTGTYCETRQASSLRYATRTPADPCIPNTCHNGGTCRPDYSNMMNHTCDCPLEYSGDSCQMQFTLQQNVGFNGNGYVELPANLVNYETLESRPVVIAIRANTVHDGVLVYQREAMAPLDTGDFIMIRIDHGHVVVEWDMGSGINQLSINSDDGKAGFVTDGEMHRIVVTLLADGRLELAVDGNTEQSFTTGISNRMNADSNIYIGGMPKSLNVNRFPGLIGCIDQVEFMDTGHGVNLGTTAVTGRNTHPCKKF